MNSQRFEDRFWSKVAKGEGPDACWLWTGSTNGATGYGWVHVHWDGGHNGRRVTYTSHRAAWELTHGAIPDGLMVCHRCDVRLCVRPEHLFLGTARDNAKDASQKGRMRGRINEPRAKLTERIASEVKRRLALGARRTDLAREFGVTACAISDIGRGRTWKRA